MRSVISPDAWRRGWIAKFTPYGASTDDHRIMEPMSVVGRQLPMALSLQIHNKPNHLDAVMVGPITSFASTETGVYAAGQWLDPAAVPEVNRAIAIVDAGLGRPSLDLLPAGLVAAPETNEHGEQVIRYFSAKTSGATMVAAAAFDGTFVRLGPESGDVDEAFAILRAGGFDGAAAVIASKDPGVPTTFALTGTTSWRSMPIAPRELKFDRDDAVARIMQWAGENEAKRRSMFLIVRPQFAEGSLDRYVFPIGDILDGKPHVVFHAIYSAAAILNGAHGGVKDVSNDERHRLMKTIAEIYHRMSQHYGDPGLEAPWIRRGKLPENTTSRTASANPSGGAPVAPPRSWFHTPEPDHPTMVTITPEGRVSGHLAPKDSCHITLSKLAGKCVAPPTSHTGYQVFHTGSVVTAEGDTLKVGRITVDTTHPVGPVGANLNASAAAAHYDNTGSCAAIVRAVDGKHGIWLSGAMVPEAGEQKRALLRRHPLSGDWREKNGNLELVAALAVNSPGFPVFSINDEGAQVSLVASATPGCFETADPGIVEGVDDETNTDTVVDGAPSDTPPATEPQDTQPPAAEPVGLTANQVQELVDTLLGQRAERDQLIEELDAMGLEEWSGLSEALDALGDLPPLPDEGDGA